MPLSKVNRQIFIWLGIVALLLLAMVMLGGLTRLTDSGLSITEWKPVTGAVPPLSQNAWAAEFEKYKQIPQFRIVNRTMTLDEFKGIYWWEWAHRFVGRLIGLVFFAPFVYFLLTRKIEKHLVPRLAVIFALGAAQGALGWFMVKSGLVHRVEVSQYRLAAHLTLAFTILAAVLWTMFDLWAQGRDKVKTTPRARELAIGFLVLVGLQIIMGAFVAGLDAGFAYNTWPLMGGRLIPHGMGFILEETTAAQFTHRMIAYCVFACAIAVYWQARGASRGQLRSAKSVLHMTLLQVVLGIATLLSVIAIPLAAAHQLGAALLLGTALFHLHTVTVRADRP